MTLSLFMMMGKVEVQILGQYVMWFNIQGTVLSLQTKKHLLTLY